MRVSHQTRAFVRGSPVWESHTTVVSLWFVMPTAAREERSLPSERNFFVATEMQLVTDLMISLGSCSSQLPCQGLITWELPWMLLNLSELLLMRSHRLSIIIENDKPGGGSSLP